MENKIQVLLVEDNSVCLEGLTTYLEAEKDLSISSVRTREAAIRAVKQQEIDVVLLNAMLTPPLYDGLDTAIEILEIKPMKIIMLNLVKEKNVIIDAFTIGVLNYLTEAHCEEIPSAIRDAHHNTASIHADAAALLRQEFSELKRKELRRLITPTEKEKLRLIGDGFTKKQTAEALNMTMNTVKSHIRRMIKKIGGTTAKEVAEKARRGGLFHRKGK